MGFSKAMSAGWLQVNKNAEGGPRVMRKVRLNMVCIVGDSLESHAYRKFN